jgi:uracil-DNA glycosylase
MEFLKNISDKWLDIIYKDESKIMLDNIYDILKDDLDTITPNIDNCFNWCRITPIDDIKIIILGQDPYHKKGWANGLSFSCSGSIPPSLKNIYKCLLNHGLIEEQPEHGDLTTWAKQGVLMLNTALTTQLGYAGKHMGLWLPYTQHIIKKLCKYYYDNNNKLIFMLWGKFAERLSYFINQDYHIILNWLHPSPLAQRNDNKKLLFINCTNFENANKILTDDDKSTIDWNSINKIKHNVINIKKPKHVNKKLSNSLGNAKKILNIKSNHHIVFTDGGCHPNNKSKNSRAGYALCFISGPLIDMNIYGNLDVSKVNASNIRAEGMSILRSLELIYKENDHYDITIITDCKFWIDMIEKYMPTWQKNTFNEKSNPDLTVKLWSIYSKTLKKHNIKFIHIRSHNKDGWKNYTEGTFERYCYEQNDYVDKLCNYARKNIEPNNEVLKKVEYE